MTEHLSNGQFASKEVAGAASVSEAKRMRGGFQKGRQKTGGRKPGVQNRATRDVKEFLAELVSSARVQQAVEARIEKGDAVAFFRALEHVVGKPRENAGQPQEVNVRFEWGGKDG